MVLKKFIEYTSFIFKKFSLKISFLTILSSINAVSDLIILLSISKIIDNPEELLFGYSIKYIFGFGIFIKFIGQLTFSYYLKLTMTKINLFVISFLFNKICHLSPKVLSNLNEDEYKGITSFQVNQLNQIVLLPFIRVVSDLFVLIVVIYFLTQLSFELFLYLLGIVLIYGVYLKYTNSRIRFNAEIIYSEFKSIIFFTENFFNGKLDFTSIRKNYDYHNEILQTFGAHQNSTNLNVMLSSLKKTVLEILIFGFLLIQLVSGSLELSELAVLFFVLIRLIPITNNANLFFSNVNLNKDVLLKVNNSVHGVF